MSQSITDRMSHVMQINELMSDSIEISYHFDELSNVIDSAMHGTSLIHIPVPVQYGRTTVPYVQYTCTPVQCTVHVLPVVPYTNKFVLTASPGVRSDTASSGFRRKSPFSSSARSQLPTGNLTVYERLGNLTEVLSLDTMAPKLADPLKENTKEGTTHKTQNKSRY